VNFRSDPELSFGMLQNHKNRTTRKRRRSIAKARSATLAAVRGARGFARLELGALQAPDSDRGAGDHALHGLSEIFRADTDARPLQKAADKHWRNTLMKKALVLSCGCALLALSALPALAVESNYTAASTSSAEAVWTKIGDFCGIGNWFPGLKCALSADGKTRTLTTEQGAVLVEQLESRDDAARSYSYTIVSGPLPVANYHSTLSVVPAGAGSSIVWTGKYDAKGASDADAKKVIDGIYKTGADSLAK
jgi:hypothetical protein